MKNLSITLSGRAVLVLITSVLASGGAIGWLVKNRGNAILETRSANTILSPSRWHPAPAPLSTQFARSVTPTNARNDYPRPQFVRAEWQSLNGLWEFGFDNLNIGEREGWHTGKTFAEQILVPFTFESSLSGIGRGDEIHEDVWYRRNFDIPDTWKNKRYLLHFGAVDWEATVWVNGHKVGTHRGGYTPFTLDITDAIQAGNSVQELVVHAHDPSDTNPSGWQPRGKQRGSSGIWYTRTTGIWQSVWLEPVAQSYLAETTMTPSFDAANVGRLSLSTRIAHAGPGTTVETSITDGSRTVATAQTAVGTNGEAAMVLSVPNAQPWSPETPRLYDLHLRVLAGGRLVDEATSYTAFRSVGIANGRLTLNGKPYFYRGVLDQGYWPDGIYTPPTDDAIKGDVEAVKRLGFNMARKHIKVEDPRWYYWCDRLGVAVWQDMPSSSNLDTTAAKQELTQEWTDILQTTRSYGCVVHWIPFNENWGNPGAFQDEIVNLTRRIDPSRPITDASGWTQRGLTDVIDAHNYSDSLVQEGISLPGKPKVIGEFGGVGFSVPRHVWAEGRVYVHANTTHEMLDLIRVRTSSAYQAANLSGFVYTQLTDVEHELNGLLTYDRQPKADARTLSALMRGEDRSRPLPGTPLNNWLVLGPIPAPVTVHGTTSTPEAIDQMSKILTTSYLADEPKIHPVVGQAMQARGAALKWQKVSTGSIDFQRVFPGEMHANSVAYAVAYIDTPRAVREATLYLGSDDGVVAWLNGEQIFKKVAIRGLKSREDKVTGLSLHPGRNVLVFKVGQGQGGWALEAFLDPR